ncbi:transcriptional regulator [Caballeronia sp. LZ065]|uniref:helix-turn-helix domain-containing protein n=1 Tax=Caballeronia sp. LZ065 TaxID=3038571 RepID=UPI00285C5218|nr:helix-turn-helix domain-containing protein [Caballeronia sp. LZ065]MDR5781265.1 transcriptional regulator [Caballeronia sp. LZ065]
MSFIDQVRALLSRRGTSVTELGELTGIARPNLSATLAGKHDARSTTLDALAAGLDAQWVLVPKEHLAVVRQVLAGKGTGPDREAPSAADMFLMRRIDKGRP